MKDVLTQALAALVSVRSALWLQIEPKHGTKAASEYFDVVLADKAIAKLEAALAAPQATHVSKYGSPELQAAILANLTDAAPQDSILAITTAYEQGVGKGKQRRDVACPYVPGDCHEGLGAHHVYCRVIGEDV